MAGHTRFELAIFSVTGRRELQASPMAYENGLAGVLGFEPRDEHDATTVLEAVGPNRIARHSRIILLTL